MNESQTLARYIFETHYNDLPQDVVTVTKKAFLDGLGVILAASTLGEGCKPFINLAIAGGGKKESTIIGFDAKVPSYMAAFANGSMSHALDFEDAHEGALLHPNAATIPAALAIAESIGGVNGKEMITALTLGSDVVCRLGVALNENPLNYGWYIPPILGAFGGTTAASKLLGLSAEQILDAFSLCLCQNTCSAELMHSPHSDVRAIRDGFSSKAGVLSALLAKGGVRGFDQPIEGKAGLFSLYSRGNYNPLELIKGLGKTFESAGISFKPWPSCRGTHAYVEATLELVNKNDIKPMDVEEIRVAVGAESLSRRLCEPLERKRHPITAIDAKFSIPFVVATTLVYREVTLHHFTSRALVNPDVLEVADKITYDVDNHLRWRDSVQGSVQIKLKHGEVKSKTIEVVYGHPLNPISEERLIEKFMNCAAFSSKPISKETLNKVVELILSLEEVKNISDITDCL